MVAQLQDLLISKLATIGTSGAQPYIFQYFVVNKAYHHIKLHVCSI